MIDSYGFIMYQKRNDGWVSPETFMGLILRYYSNGRVGEDCRILREIADNPQTSPPDLAHSDEKPNPLGLGAG
jgi:hypothetical protein